MDEIKSSKILAFPRHGRRRAGTVTIGPRPRSHEVKSAVGPEVLTRQGRREREPESPQAFKIVITILKIFWLGNRAEKTLALGKLLAIL
jgi:hypothetical protein